MPIQILDEFTKLNISKGTRLYLRRKKAGLCPLCGKKRDRKDRANCLPCRKRQSFHNKKRNRKLGITPSKPDKRTLKNKYNYLLK